MGEDRPGYDEKLAQILRASAVVFADKGYHRASVRDISRATGVSLAGLYHYVASKEELLFRIQDHCFGTVLENLERRLEEVSEPERRLRVLIDNHLRYFANNMKEMKVLSHEAESLTGEWRRKVNGRKRQYVQTCIGVLRELRPDAAEQEARTAAFALFGMLNWIYNWYQPERDVPVRELAEQMSQLFLRGYVTGGGDAFVTKDAASGPAPSIWRS